MKMQAAAVPKPIKVEINVKAKKFLEVEAEVIQEEEVVLRLQQDDELSGKKSPSLSGPVGYFWHKSIFIHVDHVI